MKHTLFFKPEMTALSLSLIKHLSVIRATTSRGQIRLQKWRTLAFTNNVLLHCFAYRPSMGIPVLSTARQLLLRCSTQIHPCIRLSPLLASVPPAPNEATTSLPPNPSYATMSAQNINHPWTPPKCANPYTCFQGSFACCSVLLVSFCHYYLPLFLSFLPRFAFLAAPTNIIKCYSVTACLAPWLKSGRRTVSSL